MFSIRSASVHTDMASDKRPCRSADAVSDEKQLLERVRDLDPEALGEIYDRYAPKIYRYIYRQLGGDYTLAHKMTAEDLTEEVFLRLLKASRADNLWKTSFSGWLFRIAHNLVVDNFRKHERVRRVSLDDVPDIPSFCGDPARILEGKLLQQQLLLVMQHVTDNQAEVLSLRFLEGFSIAEVAKKTGRSEGSVKGLQYRGVLSLRLRFPTLSDMEKGNGVRARTPGYERSVRRQPAGLPCGT